MQGTTVFGSTNILSRTSVIDQFFLPSSIHPIDPSAPGGVAYMREPVYSKEVCFNGLSTGS